MSETDLNEHQLTERVYWQVTDMIRTSDPYKQALYKHLFLGLTLEQAGASIDVKKQSIHQVKKRFMEAYEKAITTASVLNQSRQRTKKK